MLAPLGEAAHSRDYARRVLGFRMWAVKNSEKRRLAQPTTSPSWGRLKLREGRFVSALDATQYFCTVGSGIAEEFCQGSVLGETVRLERALHRVDGVVGRVDGTQRTVDVNRSVFVPIKGARRLTPKATLRNVVVRRAPETDYREVMHQIREYFQAVVPNNTTPVLIAPSSRPRASSAASTGPRAGSM